MGIVPVWGFQLAIGIPAAIFMRLNKALFIIAANISIFPFTPFIWMASLITGKWLLGNKEWIVAWKDFTLQRFMQEGLAFFLGGTVLSIAAGIVAYVVTYVLLLLFRGKR
jgi:uncharacterized protein (DUF2062 family)